eukprot:SAG31_NODE_3168_length_4593_cov_205.949933_4_plen_36_part_00
MFLQNRELCQRYGYDYIDFFNVTVPRWNLAEGNGW